MAAVQLSLEPCGLCLEPYLDTSGRIPKVLTCGHTFCARCLESYRSAGSRTCPIRCREELPPIGTPFTTNFIVLRYLLPQVKESEQALQEGAAGQPAGIQELTPPNQALLMKAEALLAAGNTQEGERIFNELIGKTSSEDYYNQRARAQLGWIHTDLPEHRARIVQALSPLADSPFLDVQVIAHLALAKVRLNGRNYESARAHLGRVQAYDARGVLRETVLQDYVPLWLEYANGQGTITAKFHVLSAVLDKNNRLLEYQAEALAFCELCSQQTTDVNPFLRKLKDHADTQPGIRCRAILQLARNLSTRPYNFSPPGPFFDADYTSYYDTLPERWSEVVRLLRPLLDIEDRVLRRDIQRELATIYERREEFPLATGVVHTLVQELSDPPSPERIDAQLWLARLYHKIGGESLPLRNGVVEQIIQNPAATEEQKTQAKKLKGYEVFDKCSVQ